MAEVVYRRAALLDLEGIVVRIAIDDPGGARRFRDRMLDRIDVLRRLPESAQPGPNSEPISGRSRSAATSRSSAWPCPRSRSCGSFTAHAISHA
jgi:plasmid stabilization system protein ParE